MVLESEGIGFSIVGIHGRMGNTGKSRVKNELWYSSGWK